MSTDGQGLQARPGQSRLSLLLGSRTEAKQRNQPRIAQTERGGQHQHLFNGIRRLAGLDGLPLRRRQASQRRQLLEGPAVQIAAVADTPPRRAGRSVGDRRWCDGRRVDDADTSYSYEYYYRKGAPRQEGAARIELQVEYVLIGAPSQSPAGKFTEEMFFEGDQHPLNPMRYLPTPFHTKYAQQRTALSQYIQQEAVGTRMRRWERPGYAMLPQLSGEPNATCRWTGWPKSWPSPDRFAAGPHGGQQQNNPNPTTFLNRTEDRKCERNWTLPP